MKITAEDLQSALMAIVPMEEHGDYLTLEQMDDDTRKQIGMVAEVLTQRFIAPLEALVRDQQALMDDIIFPLGDPLDAPDPRAIKRVAFRKRAQYLLGEEVK